jgi:hypothetical protein
VSDDLREREPQRDQADLPAEAGTRSDHGASGGASLAGSPAGGAPAGGGYGTPSGRGSGGTGEAAERIGQDSQTDWLRDAPGDGASGSDDDGSGTSSPATPGTGGVTRTQPDTDADW